VELYLHLSIRLYGIVLNLTNTGTNYLTGYTRRPTIEYDKVQWRHLILVGLLDS
jgi:hypothetical protein